MGLGCGDHRLSPAGAGWTYPRTTPDPLGSTQVGLKGKEGLVLEPEFRVLGPLEVLGGRR